MNAWESFVDLFRIRQRTAYVIYVFDHHAYLRYIDTCGSSTFWLRRRVGYVGKTRYVPYLKRVDEHLGLSNRFPNARQAWADLACDSRALVSAKMPGIVMWLIEVVLIITLRPLYNDRWNRWNRRRVPLGEQRRQERVRMAVRRA